MIRKDLNLNLVVDSNASDPSTEDMRSELRSTFSKAIGTGFRPHAKQIMKLRFGIGLKDADALTYSQEETALILGISCRYCRAIEFSSLIKLERRTELRNFA